VTSEQFRHDPSGKVFSVADLSTDGMGIRIINPDDLALFALNDMTEGMINLRREKFMCRARIRRVSADLVGCQFEDLPTATSNALEEFFDPVALGAGLRPAPASDESSLWYHGPSGTDLLLWRRPDGQYHRLALFVMGSFVQWTESDGVSTGKVRSAGEGKPDEGNVVSLETMLLQPDYRPDQGKIAIARTLISHSGLPDELKQWCTRQLDRKPT